MDTKGGRQGWGELGLTHMHDFLKVIYLLLHWVFVAAWTFSSYNKRGRLSGCGAQASHCGGFSCCRAQALGMGFSSCRSQALGHRLSSCDVLA